MGYFNIEYLFYKAYIFLRESYYFVMSIHWKTLHFWAQLIAGIIVFFMIAGIVYNIFRITRLLSKK